MRPTDFVKPYYEAEEDGWYDELQVSLLKRFTWVMTRTPQPVNDSLFLSKFERGGPPR